MEATMSEISPLTSGLFALGGALIGGLTALFVQILAQRREDKRAMRRIAYEAAMLHWKTLRSEGTKAPVTDFLRFHHAAASNFGIKDIFSDKKLASYLDAIDQGLLQRLAAQEKENGDSAATKSRTENERLR